MASVSVFCIICATSLHGDNFSARRHCQLLVWSQLAVSEGFGGITYCLADSNFGVSHGSVS